MGIETGEYFECAPRATIIKKLYEEIKQNAEDIGKYSFGDLVMQLIYQGPDEKEIRRKGSRIGELVLMVEGELKRRKIQIFYGTTLEEAVRATTPIKR